MIICICNDVSESEIRDVVREHDVKTVDQLREHMTICNLCCGCEYMIEQIIEGKTLGY